MSAVVATRAVVAARAVVASVASLAWVLALALPSTAGAEQILIQNVQGYTLVGHRLERFGALAFDGGRVLRTGDAPALRRAYPRAQRIDGAGRTLLPGLIDVHGHVLGLGFELVQIQLFDSTSLEQAQDEIRSYARAHPDLTWYQGFGWDQVAWKLGRMPLASELDAAVADRPVVLSRIDGHARWLNTQALHAAGITRDTPDPMGGRIERDAEGNPSGVLLDRAVELVTRVLPKPSAAEQLQALQSALHYLNSVGLTSAGDAGDPASTIALYRQLADRHQLTLRMYAMILDTGADFQQLSKRGPLIGYGEDHLTVRTVKLFADGALGSRGAALLAPYSDQPDQRGLLYMSDADMEGKIQTALKAGYQVCVHAIGDAANHQVLGAFDAAYRAVGGRQLRNRIEHAQVVALSDIPRFKQLNLIASMQPIAAPEDMNMAEQRIGPERLKGAYAWRTFLDQGTIIAGGSDYPIAPPSPFFGLHAAVTRTDHDNQPPGGWHPEQAMTLLEAFRAYTLDAAYAQHQEGRTGSLEPGKWADFILIDRDLFGIPVEDIWKIKVEQTWVAGRQVY